MLIYSIVLILMMLLNSSPAAIAIKTRIRRDPVGRIQESKKTAINGKEGSEA